MSNNTSTLFINSLISYSDIKSSEFIGTTGNIYNSLVSGSISYNTSLNGVSTRQRTSRANANNCVSNWVTRSTTGIDNDWRSICWSPELTLFVAVSSFGTGNRVMTSPNGITWTSRSSAADNDWYSVCWSPELLLFVAVTNSGTGNRVMTSPNGINWTPRSTTGIDNSWVSVCWSPELSIFVAVANTGSGDRVMTSPDGITWTTRSSAANISWSCICWSSELSIFVVVAQSGTGNRVMTSPNGINWTSRTSASDNNWYSVCWSSELSIFVAVAYTGSGNRVMTSINGINWTSRTSAADNNWNSVCWSSELSIFVAVAYSGTGNRVMTSANGINWTTRSSAVDNNWNSVCWSPELSIFVSVGTSGTGNRVMSSNYGIPNRLSSLMVNPGYLNVNNTNGNIGIGTSTPNSQLQFNNNLTNRKIVLLENSNNDNQFSGFGTNTNLLRYQVADVTNDHIFCAGTSSASSNELLRIKGNGNIGLGTTTANAPLQFANTIASRKIVFWESANNDHQFSGFGINGGIFRHQVGDTANNYIFYAATSSSTSNELMRIKGDGNVGIGTSDPQTNKLSVNGHIFVGSSNSIRIPVGSFLNFGFGETKETNAGMIGYERYTGGFLDIVGAGTGNRHIRFSDNVVVQTSLQAPNFFMGTSKVHNKYSIKAPNQGDILTASDFNLQFRMSGQIWQIATISGTLQIYGGAQRFYGGTSASTVNIGIALTTTFQNIVSNTTGSSGDKLVFTFANNTVSYTFTGMTNNGFSNCILMVEKLV